MNKKLLILGGGFGLYGYLPAACESGFEVFTLTRYKPKIQKRKELKKYRDCINFVFEDNIDVNYFGIIVLARTPIQQQEFITTNNNYSGHYCLEKPLGFNSEATYSILQAIQTHSINFSIAYLFRYQEWYKHLILNSTGAFVVEINWVVKRNFKNSWKLFDSNGGGLLSYFGIHLLSLLVDLKVSPDSIDFRLKRDKLVIYASQGIFLLTISYGNHNQFQVKLKSHKESFSWASDSPFGTNPRSGLPDPRIPSLVHYLREAVGEPSSTHQINHELRILEFRRKFEEQFKPIYVKEKEWNEI